MEDTTEDILKWATRDPKIVADASIICRLMDDIAGGEGRLPFPRLDTPCGKTFHLKAFQATPLCGVPEAGYPCLSVTPARRRRGLVRTQ
ncbi:hypothetical protein RIF29_31173 [Crotalaria pallida]|uniref:Uncharacterized protein n=1 Tax=Crotalaria pallida TaxID=3830 RepID=A0AAN9EHH8_CROPI